MTFYEEFPASDHKMTNRNAESTQEYAGGTPPPLPPLPPPPSSSLSRDQPDSPYHRGGNMVFKSGLLFLSSKGIGWTSWKKRWFILTSTSLVFFRSDPSAVPQKGSEVNLTLGGIDLNNSGSVVVKADKKLLTVLFPNGRDGRAFTLKAETLEDLQEWKAALENALAQAPSAGHSMGQNGVFKNDQTDSLDGTSDQLKNRLPARSTVLGRPLLLALEDVDGTPTFLEKALKFMEEHGVKVEGILRQAADVDDVERRVREYEKGKSEFSPDEDAHVIGDCVKYVLRELPSSPVPASCCNALLEACRTDRGVRVNAMRTAIYETFPEPNRRLLQRILMMMQSVAAHKAENRMSTSAVAACMAPLLLRPLLSGDCEIESDFNVGGDGSIQLLQAAAAANHAQAIVITLLEEYNSIFGEGSMSPELYSDTEDSGSESGEATDDELSYDDEEQEYTSGSDSIDDEDVISETCSEDDNSGDNDLYDDKDSHGSTFISKSTRVYDKTKSNRETLSSRIDKDHSTESVLNHGKSSSNIQNHKFAEALGDVSRDTSLIHRSFDRDPSSHIQHSATMSNGNDYNSRRRTVWGRTAAKKNLSMESIDYSLEDEAEIQQFEVRKRELQNKIVEEVKENAILQVGLERRKKALHEHRQALEQDVEKLQERLQKERDLRAALEVGEMGLKGSQVPLPSLANIDEKTKAELEEISVLEVDIVNLKQKMDGLVVRLDQQYQTKKNKHIDADVIHQSFFERSKSKETNLDKKGNENERKPEPAVIANKNPPQNQCLNSVRNSVGVPIDFCVVEPEQGRYNDPVISKRSSIRGEGANSTSSALTKLTTRLNFLKERRSQIANELQNMDKFRVSGQSFENIEKNKGSVPDISIQTSENSHASAAPSIQNREKGRTNSFQSLQTSENEGVHPEVTRKSFTDVGKTSEGRRLQSLERGKSDTYPTDKVDE